MFAVRIYATENNGFENKEPYIAACIAQRIRTTDEYEISLMIGEFGHEAMTEVLKKAKTYGATKLWYERHGKLRSLRVR